MKASIITEIARTISADLTSTAKPSTTEAERRLRWELLGVKASADIPAIDSGSAE